MKSCWLYIFILFLQGCNSESPELPVRPVKVVQIKSADSSRHSLSFPGTLRAFQRADLAFRIDGTLIWREIYVGYNAKKNEILAKLDPREYQIALAKAKGQVDSIQAQLDFAERDYERMKKIREKDPGAISESLLDRKNESKNRLLAELTIAQGDLAQASDNLSYTELKAPFNGIVAAIYVENHEQVRAKETVLRFLDTADREMEIQIPEKYMQKLLEGKETLLFHVRLDAFPKVELKASVKEISTEASSTTQTYPVTLSLHDVPLELSLLAGMSGRATVGHTKTPTGGVFVPDSAIFTVDGHSNFVWIIDTKNNTVHKQQLSIEKRTDGGAIVSNGISPGSWAVTAGTSFLVEGQKVKFASEPSVQ